MYKTMAMIHPHRGHCTDKNGNMIAMRPYKSISNCQVTAHQRRASKSECGANDTSSLSSCMESGGFCMYELKSTLSDQVTTGEPHWISLFLGPVPDVHDLRRDEFIIRPLDWNPCRFSFTMAFVHCGSPFITNLFHYSPFAQKVRIIVDTHELKDIVHSLIPSLRCHDEDSAASAQHHSLTLDTCSVPRERTGLMIATL